MKIRPAAEDEAAALSELALRAKAHWGYPAEQIERWRDELSIAAADIRDNPTFVAVEGKHIVGFYSLKPSAASCELDNLWVEPGSMRQGIGRALLFHALQEAGRRGATKVAVDADPHAAAFYTGLGATQLGVIPAPIPGQPDRVRPQLAFEKVTGASAAFTEILNRVSYAIGLGSVAFLVIALPALFWPHELGKYFNGYSYLLTLVVAYFFVPFARRYMPRFK